MVFRRRAATTGKAEVPDAMKKEVGLSFYYDVVQNVTRHNIPPSLTMNLDQTPSKIVPGSKVTLAKIGSTTSDCWFYREKSYHLDICNYFKQGFPNDSKNLRM